MTHHMTDQTHQAEQVGRSQKPILTNLATRIVNTPLLITQNKLNAIIGAVGGRIGLQVPEDLLSPVYVGPERATEETAGEIAVIPVYDVLVNRTNGLMALSGLTSYEQIRADFRQALNDPAVETIVFDIDSPGGEVAGCFDLVDEIFAARGEKGIFAVANEAAYSAAYAIASAADRIYLPRTAGVGSVGVIAVHVDQSAWDEKLGVKYTPVFAGKRKNDFSPHQAMSEEAFAVLQAEIDEVYDIFVETVARNKDMTVSAVRNTEAGIYQGKKAVKAGLADKVLSWDQAIKSISDNNKKGGGFMGFKESFLSIFGKASKEEADQVLADAGYVPVPEEAGGTPAQTQALEGSDAETRQAAVQQGRQEATAGAVTIMEICSLAGMPGMAVDLVKEGVSEDEARKRVLEAKAGDSEETDVTSTVGALSTGERNPLVADARRRAGK